MTNSERKAVANPFKQPSPKSRGVPTAGEAQAIAQSVLLFLLEDPSRTHSLLDASGLDPSTLRKRAGDPELLTFVLDHVLADESLLLAFCANAQMKPETLTAAAHILSGTAHD
jgi:hypothetical protein